MPSRRALLFGTVAAGAAAVFGAAAVVATRPRSPRWHTDTFPPDPHQVLSPAPVGVFGHSVASGDPTADSVRLWTRVTPSGSFDEVHVALEVASDPAFTEVVVSRDVVASVTDDFCVGVTVPGLTADSVYFYRFAALGASSPIGRTRTLPTSGPVRLAFAACASYGHGRFWPYEGIAARSDLHAVVHLGDYIYDTPGWGHPGTYGTARQVDPPAGCVTLDDYRARYSQARADPQLQELHRQHPVIPIWDDHEFADDPRPGGATGHDPELHGEWRDRVTAATRAWYEWMPVPSPSGRIWRSFDFGSTAELVVVDRLYEALHNHSSEPLDGTQERFVNERARDCEARWFVLGSGAGIASRSVDLSGGWPAATRTQLLESLDGTPLLSVGGDSHRMEALGIVTSEDGDLAPGAEFATGSVSSPGVPWDPDRVGDHVLLVDKEHRGYCVATLETSSAQVDFFGVPDAAVRSDDRPVEEWLAGFVVSGDAELPAKADAPAPSGENSPQLAP